MYAYSIDPTILAKILHSLIHILITIQLFLEVSPKVIMVGLMNLSILNLMISAFYSVQFSSVQSRHSVVSESL